jgi:anti-sigma B factor antagonist
MTSWIFPRPEADHRSPSDALSVTLELHGDVTFVVLDGPVCAFTAPHLATELTRALDAGRNRLVIDTSSVRTMSADGIDVLVHHAERCRAAGGDLVLRNPSPVTRRVLDICGLQRLFAGMGTATA